MQAVVITSSDPSHAGYVLEALKAGKYVFCEKPLAQNAEDCEKIIAAETAHGKRLLQVALCAIMTALRRDEAYHRLRRAGCAADDSRVPPQRVSAGRLPDRDGRFQRCNP